MKKDDTEMFFKNLTDRSGAYSEESVRNVYFGLVKLITDGFRAGAVVELPHIGKFSVRTRVARFKGNPWGGEKQFMQATKEVKFDPNYIFRKYVRGMKMNGE